MAHMSQFQNVYAIRPPPPLLTVDIFFVRKREREDAPTKKGKRAKGQIIIRRTKASLYLLMCIKYLFMVVMYRGEDDFVSLSFSKEHTYSPNARKCYLLVTQCDTRMILEDGTANQNTISLQDE